MSLIVSFFAPATAGTPVLHADADRDAVERASARSGRAVADLEGLPAGELLGRVPALLVGGAESAVCTGEPSRAGDLDEALTTARGKALYLDFQAARAVLTDAEAALACLVEPVGPEQLAALGFLAGYAAASEGDEAAAIEGFALALAADPGLAWDPDLPDTGRELLEGLRAAVEAPAVIAGSPVGAALTLDGRAWSGSAEVAPGRHVVQLEQEEGWATAVLRVASGAEVGVVATGAGSLPSWPGDPELHEPLDQVLSAGGVTGELYAVASSTVWHRAESSWTALEESGRELDWRPIARWGGAGLAVGGGVLAGLSYAQGMEAHQAASAAVEELDEEAYEAAEPEFQAASGRLLIGDLVAATGLVVFGASWVF